MCIEVVKAGTPVALVDVSAAEAAVECGRGGSEGARSGGAIIYFFIGNLVCAREVGSKCVEVVGDVFACARFVV